MSTLNSLFDVVRGWPNSACIDETFKIHSSVLPTAPLVEGDIVEVQTDGTVARATATDLATSASVAVLAEALAKQKQLWLVVSGTTQHNYDGLNHANVGGKLGYAAWKVVCIRGTYMFETEEFEAGVYQTGDSVTVNAGKVAAMVPGEGKRKYGEVISYDASRNLLTVCV